MESRLLGKDIILHLSMLKCIKLLNYKTKDSSFFWKVTQSAKDLVLDFKVLNHPQT